MRILRQLKEVRENARLTAFYKKYERFLLPAFLVAGFLGHALTFKALDVRLTFALLGAYLLLAAACILYVAAFDGRVSPWKHPLLQRLRLASPLLLQIAFGSLLSMSLLFYWFSGAVSVSWPILAIVAALVVFNEKFRHLYERPVVQVPFFAFVLFSYLSALFPYLFNSLDVRFFVAAGVASLALSLLLVLALARLASALRPRGKLYALLVVGVCAAMFGLYFGNVIPPIPLSLRDAGIYHNVQRVGSDYVLTGEPETWWQRLLPVQTVHMQNGGRLYAFTAVYAPTDLDTTIYHRWERYDAAAGKWITYARLSFDVTGGRADGYRGYTFVTRPTAGQWRVTVETARGQVLGRLSFTYVP